MDPQAHKCNPPKSEFSLSGPTFIKLLRVLLDRGVPFRLRTQGISMHPFIKNGDLITVSPLPTVLPRLGDVVAFLSPRGRRIVAHRVIGKRGNLLLTKGDNISRADRPISAADILGYVTKVERNGNEFSLGLGPERLIIALLTRRGRLYPLLFPVWKLVRPIARWCRSE